MFQKLSQYINCVSRFEVLKNNLSPKISTTQRPLALQNKRHLIFFPLLLLLCCSNLVYAQDLPNKDSLDLPAKRDTLTVNPTDIIDLNELRELDEEVVDTVKTDTVKSKEPELLTDVVEYYGEDYVYIDRKSGKIYMYNKAFIIYESNRIDAGLIILDYKKNEVYAKGIDSAGVYTQAPIFEQGANKIEPDSLKFNMDTKKAISYNSRTKSGDINVIPEITKKENDSVYFFSKVKFTTSDDPVNPEYYFLAQKAKFVPKKKIVTGLVNMYIADVPTPIGLPFAFFPLTEDRTSGFLLPSIGENNNRGFFFQNGGYYFALNDYVDLTLVGDYYTNGSYALRGDSDYAVRYKFNGNVSVRYENLINSERGFDDFSQSALYNIRWRHSQDAKANPSSRFTASVNLGSSQYLSRSINQTNNGSTLVNTLSSSVSYSKSFDTEPQVNFTVAATHTQNTQTEEITMSLPNFNGSISRVFPFAPKSGVKKGIIQNINLQYNVTAENRILTTDELFFKPEMFDAAQIGARHSIPISTNFKVLDYLSFTAGTNYQEVWVGKTTRQSYDTTLNNGAGGVVRDTVSGFDSYRTYGFSTGVGTTIYGLFDFGKEKKVQSIRHVVRPSVSYNITPGFDQFYDEYVIPATADPDLNEEIVSYSRFENTLYGAPGNQFSSAISYSLSNTLEAKVRDRDTTALVPKKVSLLNNLNFSGGYSITRDSLNWDPLRFSMGIPIVKKLDLNINGGLDPYALNNDNQKIDQFNIDNGGSLFRLTNANVSFNYSFSSKDFQSNGDEETGEEFENETFRNGGRPDDLFGTSTDLANQDSNARNNKRDKDKEQSWYQYDMPWDLRLAYTFNYSNAQRQNEISSQSIMFSSGVELSPKWNIRLSSGYDFTRKGVTLTQIRFERDLDSWYSWLSWTPIGATNTSWNFFIGIRGSLSDIKYDKRRESDRQL